MRLSKILLIFTVFLVVFFTQRSVFAQTDDSANNVMVGFLKAFFPSSPSTGGENNSGSPLAPSLPRATSFTSFREIFNEVGGKMGIPPRLLEAVQAIEHGDYLTNFTPEQVNTYSTPGNVIPRCGPNSCSAAGPMQMTMGIDDRGSSVCAHCGAGLTQCPNMWGAYGKSINTNGGYSHVSNPCNLRDNIYAAAAKIKSDSGNKGGIWTKEQVFAVGLHYYGSCSERFDFINGMSYCEFLWWYYGKE